MTWTTVTGPHVFCDDCEWFKHGDEIGAQRLALLARAHADERGHRLQIQRGQLRIVVPKTTAKSGEDSR